MPREDEGGGRVEASQPMAGRRPRAGAVATLDVSECPVR